VIFKARWAGSGITTNVNLEYGLQVFCGLIAFNLVAEVIGQSPALITNRVNYVKKIIFPLEILAVTAVISSLFSATIAIFSLMICIAIISGAVHLEWLWLPLIFANLAGLTLCATWLISASAVYVRDIGQVISLGLNLLMFLTPIFYSIQSLPPQFQAIAALNPLAIIVQQIRSVLLEFKAPDPVQLIISSIITLLIMELTCRLFKRMSRNFADIL